MKRERKKATGMSVSQITPLPDVRYARSPAVKMTLKEKSECMAGAGVWREDGEEKREGEAVASWQEDIGRKGDMCLLGLVEGLCQLTLHSSA
jgi:hypothetical protein